MLPELSLRPSVFLRTALIGLHGVAAGALLYGNPGTRFVVAGGLLLLVSLVRQLYRYGTARSSGFVTRIAVGDDGNWRLVYGDGTVRQLVLKRYYVQAWLLILQFRGRFPASSPALVIPADAADAENLCRLRRYLFRLDWSAEV